MATTFMGVDHPVSVVMTGMTATAISLHLLFNL